VVLKLFNLIPKVYRLPYLQYFTSILIVGKAFEGIVQIDKLTTEVIFGKSLHNPTTGKTENTLA
jgi:hypothetical protein